MKIVEAEHEKALQKEKLEEEKLFRECSFGWI